MTFSFVFLVLCISFINSIYKEIELKLKNKETDYDLPLYFETTDLCSKWVPSLFSSVALIDNMISVMGHYKTIIDNIYIQNIFTIKYFDQPIQSKIFLYTSIFNEIYIAKTYNLFPIIWPKYCLFGLDYSEIIYNKQNLNTIKNLLPKQIEKNIFSFGKWDLTKQDFIYSRFYIGDYHENFSGNTGTCNIQNETNYYGCIFNEFIFLNETYSLINENNNKPYIIYFSSEFNKIYFPKNFENKIKNCYLQKNKSEFICEKLKNKDYLSLKLRNDNMEITLEVDKINRFYNYSSSDGTTNILFHDFEYIIFPLVMLKNFHVQFDVEKKVISFFSNDTSILKVKKKTNETQKNENSDGISIGIIIFIIILCIILIGFIGFFYYFFYYKKKYLNLEKKFIKYSKFDDENVHGLEDYENIY